MNNVLQQLTDIHAKAERAIHKDDLDDLIGDAESQGVFAGYLCPATEIQGEGLSVIDQIEGWGIPKTAIKKLRDGPAKKLAASNPMEARSALYALFGERVAWDDYIDEYEKKMRFYTRWLFGAIIVLTFASVFALHYALRFSLSSCSGFYLQAQPEVASALCRRCQPWMSASPGNSMPMAVEFQVGLVRD